MKANLQAPNTAHTQSHTLIPALLNASTLVQKGTEMEETPNTSTLLTWSEVQISVPGKKIPAELYAASSEESCAELSLTLRWL